MKSLRILSSIAAAFLVAEGPTLAGVQQGRGLLEVRYGPDERVFSYPVSGGGVPDGFVTIVLHNISVFNAGAAPVRLTRVRIDAMSNGTVTNSTVMEPRALSSAAAVWSRRAATGRLQTHEPLFQVAELIGRRRLAPTTNLEPGSGLIVARTPMLVSSDAAEIVITTQGVERGGRAVAGELRIPIVQHDSANSYRFPLCGRWLIAGGPNLNGHHRWGASQEFAIDITRVGANTQTHQRGARDVETYYSFGAPVVAVADGDVVAIESAMEDAEQLRKPGESEQEHEQRLARQQDDLIARGFRNILGNHVVLRHANGEHSIYAHLKAASVRVREGDRVARGALLAEVGNSGNSTEPHLHFSIQDGPDPIASRSLPYRFEGLRFWDEADGGTGVLNTGQIVDAGGCAPRN